MRLVSDRREHHRQALWSSSAFYETALRDPTQKQLNSHLAFISSLSLSPSPFCSAPSFPPPSAKKESNQDTRLWKFP